MQTPEYQPVDVPTDAVHPPFVPADLFLDAAPPVAIPVADATTYAYTSAEGIGWPLPEGGAYNFKAFEEYDANMVLAEGFVESLAATQWACWWLSERDAAIAADDSTSVAAMEALLDNFWTLPHVRYLDIDGASYRDQMLEEVDGNEDLLLDRLWSFGCGSSTP